MKPREKSLWKWLEAGKPAGAMLRRIEDSSQPDFPDVIGKYGECAFSTELKVATVKNGIAKIDLTSGQALFAYNWSGGSFRAWILVQAGDERFIIGGHYAKKLTQPIAITELREMSVLPGNAIAHQIIARMAGR